MRLEERETREAPLEALKRAGVETVQLGAPDIDGLYRRKRVPAEYFAKSVTKQGSPIADILFGWDVEDELMPGLRFSGWHTGYRDVVLVPDLATLRVIPWGDRSTSVVCDVRKPDGASVEIAPRTVLKRQVERAERLCYAFSIGYELEFYLFRETSSSVAEKAYANLTPATPDISTYSLYRHALVDEVIGDIRRSMGEYGIPIEASNTEYGPGQFEVNIHRSGPLETADRVLLYKAGIREIAAKHGMVASFMAKLSAEGAGSSGHIHQSLSPSDDAGRNLFWAEGRPGNRSALLGGFAAGQLATMGELTLVFCPTVNSYKRRRPGSWAPTTISWGDDNRTVGLRVIARDEASCRIEHRLPGADANPYLAIAGCIAGGLHGVEAELEPSPMVEGDAYERDDLPRPPETIEDAIEALETGTVAREAFGDEFVDHFLVTRRWERDRFRETVTDWERRRYLERI